MPTGLTRWQHEGHDHLITFSCHGRRPHLASDDSKEIFLSQLEALRKQHDLHVLAYVLMPEHVPLLLGEPKHAELAAVLRVLKVQISKKLKGNREKFWEKRYHDVNVFSWDKRMEKVKYMHRNPVKRGMVERPEDHRWSSFRHYLHGEPSPVELDTTWVEGWQRS